MDKKFYLTTAIAYTSSKPHIGNVYEAILADCIVRYKKKAGFKTYFMTGTDEHGQKIERKAQSLGITPKEHVDNISNEVKKMYKVMDVEYDHFIRTTDDYHEREVKMAFEKLYKQGDIYKGEYKGLYCVDCESYYTEKDLVDGCCPDCGAKVEEAVEEAYFLRLEPYQQRLIDHIKNHKGFIEPEARKNEMLNNFLKDPLPDLCVSRTSYKWGIPVSFDQKHVIYVWIDALLNYITGIGYHFDKPNEPLFEEFWPANVHLIGKDILRFHTIYWPIILMALGIELPEKILGHPWVLMNHNKMSKSKGNTIYADDLANYFGSDGVRYYCLHEIPYAADGNLTYELLCERYNSDLANTYGNLVSRSIAMVKKYFDNQVINNVSNNAMDKNLKEQIVSSVNNYKKLMDEYKVADGLEEAMKLLRVANKYIDETSPWVLAKNPDMKPLLKTVLYNLLEAIRISTIMLEPAIPNAAKKVYAALKTENITFDDLEYGKHGIYQVGDCEVLFKRLDINEILASLEKKEEEKAVPPSKPLISIDDFDKLDLEVGQIIEANNHPQADKLLVFKVQLGHEVRQIVSGIAKFYKPAELVGKKVIVVKNLKPIKLRGVESNGMLLCASDKDDKHLELISPIEALVGDEVR